MRVWLWLWLCVLLLLLLLLGGLPLSVSLTILVVRVGQRIQAWHYNLRALAVLPDYPGPQLNLALLYRDTFHRKDLAYIHFRECVYGRRLLTSVQECHQSQAELLLERCMRACVLACLRHCVCGCSCNRARVVCACVARCCERHP